MALRSILQFDLSEPVAQLKQFQEIYAKYQNALKGTPGVWAKVNAQIDGSKESLEDIVAEMAAAQLKQEALTKLQERADEVASRSVGRWQSLARSTREFARNIGEATVSLLRWASIGSIVGGLVGAGGLFGIERFALSAGAQRRGALGLGANIGEAQAFGVNFSRLVDPDSFLGGVARARLDVNQRTGLIAAGLTQEQISGSAGGAAAALVENLKKLADKWDPRLFAQYIEAYRLGGIVSPEDLQRLRGTPASEIAGLARNYRGDVNRFGLPEDTARRWQDFTAQLERAGQTIEQTLIRGLVPLTPGFERLSTAVVNVFDQLSRQNGPIQHWVDAIGEALGKFAGYVGKPEFEQGVTNFVDGILKIGEALATAVQWFAGARASAAGGGPLEHHNAPHLRAALSDLSFGLLGGRSLNNPGNLRIPGSSVGFQQFDTPEEGIRGIARQLQLYENRDHLNTIEQIVGKYAPPGENDTQAYIRDVAQRTGIAPGAALNPSDRDQIAKLVAAIVAHEQGPGKYDKYKDAKVVVTILNPAGANVDTSVNGLKQ